MKRIATQRGFTLVEVSIILFVLVILSSILLVNIGDFGRAARYARVMEDVGALCSAMSQMLSDTGEAAFWEWGGRGDGGDGSDSPNRDTVGMLIGDGDTPDMNWGGLADDGWKWQLPYGDWFSEPRDLSGTEEWFRVDTFANHLINNTPLSDSANAYRTPSDMVSGANSGRVPGGLLFDSVGGQGFNSRFAWRGPYINDSIEPDPWGNRYMANVFGLYSPGGAMDGDGFGTAVVCYSAGPDEEVDTAFNQPHGWVTGDDDITAVVSAGGR